MKEKFSELRIASLISGGGSTMEAIGHATQEGGELYGKVSMAVVISSKQGVAGIKRAQDLGIPHEVVLRKEYPPGDLGVEPYGRALSITLAKYHPDVVILNGLLVKISEEVIAEYEGRIFNQHPGPTPHFGGEGMYGRRVHAAVLLYNRISNTEDPYTLMTAQRVHKNIDEGAVVGSKRVDIFRSDTVESLQKRALPHEHALQIETLGKIANGVLEELTIDPMVKTQSDYLILDISKGLGKMLYPNG